jgi:AraC-like DNA-binding protein
MLNISISTGFFLIELARPYLIEMQQSIIETAFLIGYDESNSFS